ncbi:MAG TPA: class I SAM-dependent methyltransferase [Thiobacillus sp.]|nr:class I SAM-dependent methyltransferase [Thiobacillus sp.]
MTPRPSVLVFPIDMPQSVAFAHTARQLGFSVVVASSEPVDPGLYSEYTIAVLPYVTAPDFDSALAALLEQHQADRVFAPHPAIWWHLNALCQKADFPARFRVCNESPYEMDWQAYGTSYQWAEASLASRPLLPFAPSSALPLATYAGLHRAYNLIPGQSDNTKLFALTQIARQIGPGDVVEIGSLYGKSAFALTWLAHFHHVGSVICVDPWEIASIRNQGEQAHLINAAVASRDWQQVFLGFAASLAMFDNVNYVRQPSEDAATAYRQAASDGWICSDEFGSTPVQGSIALLHIDGNHRYEAVMRDLETWLPFVQDGGWVLLDDYVWAFGDGPQRAGDELLARRAVKTAFVAADTLFVQL